LGSRDVIGHVTTGFPVGHFLLMDLWNQACISNGFLDNAECDTVVDMTLNDL